MKSYYNIPLNTSKTIDLPSNLLRQKQPQRSTPLQIDNLPTSITKHQNNINQEKIGEDVTMVQQKKKTRKSVLYKRLNNIKHENNELQKYSYSKLLSKMVIVDPKQHSKTIQMYKQKNRSNSQYSCLRGRLFSIDYEQDKLKEDKNKEDNFKDRASSGIGDYANRTTRIFKRFYMPNDKFSPSFFNQNTDQKYIYINGKKTQCKRIHNFYTSQNFKTSYDKTFGQKREQNFNKTRQSYNKKHRY